MDLIAREYSSLIVVYLEKIKLDVDLMKCSVSLFACG
jgi:hypothetical protein